MNIIEGKVCNHRRKEIAVTYTGRTSHHGDQGASPAAMVQEAGGWLSGCGRRKHDILMEEWHGVLCNHP